MMDKLATAYDFVRMHAFSKQRYQRALHHVAQSWLTEVAHVGAEHPDIKHFTLYLEHPVDRRRYLPDNAWCMYPFSGRFDHTSVHAALDTLMYTGYKTHPAYAVPNMDKDEKRHVLKELVKVLESLQTAYAVHVSEPDAHPRDGSRLAITLTKRETTV